MFRYIIIFPALKMMFPALASQFILLMLATSIVSQISVQELFHAASIIQSRTFRDFEVYTVIGSGLSRRSRSSSAAVRRPLPSRVRPAMISEFSSIDVLYLIAATRWTLALTAIAFAGGGVIGLLDRADARVVVRAAARWLARIYVHIVQGTPLLAGCSSSSSACRSSA